MAPVDWNKLMAATPSKLSDDEVEEFYESMVKVSDKHCCILKCCIYLCIYLKVVIMSVICWLPRNNSFTLSHIKICLRRLWKCLSKKYKKCLVLSSSYWILKRVENTLPLCFQKSFAAEWSKCVYFWENLDFCNVSIGICCKSIKDF